MVQIEARRNGLEVRYVIQPDVPRFVKGDTTRLKQVLLNLLSNGIKFTDQGELEVIVEVLRRDSHQAQLRFNVSDTGIGISEVQMKHLFEVFTQGDATTSRKYGGTGLGLAICKKIVGLMSGEISVQSVVGIGSTFSFTANLEIVDQAPVDLREDKVNRNIFAAKRILLIEDNEINLQMTQEILGNFGFDTDTAQSGFTGVQMAGQTRYDAILMDIRMPEMDGYEATRRILELKGQDAPPIIALSADAVEGVAEKAKLAGMSGYVTKPLNPWKLIELLKHCLGIETTADFPSDNNIPVRVPVQKVWIDFARGIERLGGKQDKYLHILESFLKNHKNDYKTINQLISSDNLIDAKKLLHTLKGIAANIGAIMLNEASLRLETVLDFRDEAEIHKERCHFEMVLIESCDRVAQFVVSLPVEKETVNVEIGDIDNQLRLLVKLLEEGDSESASVYAACKYYLKKELSDLDYNQLNEKISSYNLEEAAGYIKKILGEENIR